MSGVPIKEHSIERNDLHDGAIVYLVVVLDDLQGFIIPAALCYVFRVPEYLA